MFNKLFEKKKIGNLEIKNRLIVPAMDSGLTTKEHLFSQRALDYYTARAKGGFGLIITEFLCVSQDGLSSETQAGIYDDSFITNLSELTKRLHDNGAACFAQIHHAGIQSDVKATKQIAVGASSISAPNKLQLVRELTTKDVWKLVEKFSDAALRAKKAGFDGVEIHGGHGYLVGQFLSKSTNKRIDEFGGTTTARAKFACEIIKDIKIKCGNDFPVIIRISADECLENGNTIIDSKAQAILLEKAGADAIHVSYGTIVSGTVTLPNYVQSGFNSENAKEIKKAVHIPVICVGRINDPSIAESIIASGAADFVSLGRQSICDPEFPNKIKEKRFDEIFYCSGCMQRCFYTRTCEESDVGVSCMINPFSGKEGIWEIKKVNKKKRIAIIGGGPAGLQVAWILAKRGHNVVLFEKEQYVGGQYNLASIPPFKQELAKTINTYETLCKKYGVQLNYGVEITKDNIQTLNVDAIVLATGSVPVVPPIAGINGNHIFKANDILKGRKIIGNQKVLIIGAGLVGCETAEFLNLYNNNVTIVDMIKEMAPMLSKVPRRYLLSRLKQSNVEFYSETKVLEFTFNGIKYEHNGETGELNGFDSIILAIGSKSYNPLEEISNKVCKEVYTLGDAKKATDAMLGIYEATKLGMEI